MMRIEVKVEDPPQPLVEPGQNPEHAIIEITEARSPVGTAVMGAAARHMHDPARRGEAGREQHPTR